MKKLGKNKFFALLAMVLLLSVCLVACSGGNGGGGESDSVSESGEATGAEPGTVLLPPISAKFVQSTDISYRADGKFTVDLNPDSLPASEIVAYYADGNGIMEDYAPMKTQAVSEGQLRVRFTSVDNTLIPQGAKYIYVYTAAEGVLSEDHVTVTLPEGVGDYVLGEKLGEFQVVSDTHVTADNSHKYNTRFTAMLRDIAANSPNSMGLFINGDVTDSGIAEQYANVKLLYSSVPGVPTMYSSAGNHDLPSGSIPFVEASELFTEFAGVDSVYYDKWIGGLHFIFLSAEDSSGIIQMSEDQITWLETKIREDRESGKPIFVFMHQGLYNTVAGTLQGQWCDAVGATGYDTPLGNRLKNIFKSYPEVILFTGHGHWELNSVNTMYARDDKMSYAFSTASVAYLWQAGATLNEYGESYKKSDGGSQGYYVDVYGDKLVLRGRDFAEGKWMPSATFIVDLSK